MNKNIQLPLPAKSALVKLGHDINTARRRRRISKAMMAERAGIALNTLSRIERGEPGTSMAAWAAVLFVLGLTDELRNLSDPSRDNTGLMLEEESLPKRIYYKRKHND